MLTADLDSISFRSAAAATIGGAVSGAGHGTFSPIIGGAASGAGSVLNDLIAGNEVNGGKAALNTLAGLMLTRVAPGVPGAASKGVIPGQEAVYNSFQDWGMRELFAGFAKGCAVGVSIEAGVE